MDKLENGTPGAQSRRSFIKTSAGVLGGLALTQAPLETLADNEQPSRRQPNIVVFLGEGLRYDELSCMGHPIVQTPNMDRIAREGMSFRNAFVTNALCLPSRASLLTGMYSHSVNAVGNEPTSQHSTDTGNGNGPIRTRYRWFPISCIRPVMRLAFSARHTSRAG